MAFLDFILHYFGFHLQRQTFDKNNYRLFKTISRLLNPKLCNIIDGLSQIPLINMGQTRPLFVFSTFFSIQWKCNTKFDYKSIDMCSGLEPSIHGTHKSNLLPFLPDVYPVFLQLQSHRFKEVVDYWTSRSLELLRNWVTVPFIFEFL